MRTLVPFAAFAALSAVAAAQQQIPLPPFSSTFSGQSTRGFWFQAPLPFTIVGLRVPDETGQGTQCVEVSRMTAVPPAFPTTVNPTQLFFANNQPSANIIPCAIAVNTGDIIGILGACGTATMYNSYGTSPFTTTVFGQPITLTRFLTQFNLSTTGGNQPCSTEAGGSIARVEVYVAGSAGYATATPYGTGCVRRAASVYENFATSATFDLANSGMSLVNSGTGYTGLPLLTTFVPPSANATALTLGDDAEAAVTLSAPFPYAGGATNTLAVCSNGYVSVATGNGVGYLPDPIAFLAAPQSGWWAWHDYNPSIAGSGQVKFEEVGGFAYLTWDGVWDYGGSSASNANTFQFQFDLSTGNVHLVFQTMSTAGNGRLVGYSPGGANTDPGSTDLSAALPAGIVISAQDVSPLALTATTRPVSGTTCTLQTANIPAGSPFGAMMLGLVQINPGIDLTPFGLAGCFKYTDSSTTNLFVAPGGTQTTNIPIPSGFAGVHFNVQSAVYCPAAGLTLLGGITSNGINLGIDNL